MRPMIALALVAVVPPARADGLAHRIEVGAGTAIPLSVGPEATLHASDRLLVDVSVGWMPPPYVDIINGIAVALDAYGDVESSLIEDALDNSLIVRLGVGYRPFRVPLSFHAGYTVAALGGTLTGVDAVEAVTGQALRADAGGVVVPLHSTVHLFQIGAAWRFRLPRNLVLRVALEYTQPFTSSTAVDVAGRTPQANMRIAGVNAELNDYMNDLYVTYVKAGTIDVSLRWRPGAGPAR